MPNPGDLLSGRYRILERIGSGGMATVHRAHDERLNRDVAIKVLLPNLAGDPTTAARFEREARSLAASSHPGVVAVFDVDPGDPAIGREPFFVMELCSGGSLADRLAGGARQAPDDLIPVLVSIADGLADLHRRGIVHRDVKPHNILFAADRAKLADFGVALDGDATGTTELTTPGTAIGTLAYLAPEILAGGRATAASDVYALAVVAFVGLAGTLPRAAGSIAELVGSSTSVARTVSEAAPDLGTAFDDAVAGALSSDPEARPDALELASRLTAALGRWSRQRPTADREAASPLPTGSLDQATTETAISLTQTAALTTPPPRPIRSREERRQPGWLVPAATVATVILVATAIIAAAGGLSTPLIVLPSVPVPSAEASSTRSIPPPSPSIAAPSATPAPTPDPAIAAIDDMASAIAAARGGPDGLKGKDANNLETRLEAVRRAVEAGDRSAARAAAEKLEDQVDKVAEHLGRDAATRLREAARALVQVLSG